MGEYPQVLDAKNRVFIPAKFREALGETVYITKNLQDNCLSVYTKEEWDVYYGKILALEPAVSYKMLQKVMPFTQEVAPDAQGRVVLSASLKKYASLEKDIYFIGVGNHCQIWNRDIRDAVIAGADDDGADLPVVF